MYGRALRRLAHALRTTRGAIDLASIMVGVIIIGIIGGVISASVFAIIPWAGEKAAQENLSAAVAAESVQYAKTSDKGTGHYAIDYDGSSITTETLDSNGLLKHTPNADVSVITNLWNTAYIARSVSPSGTRYYAASDGQKASAPANTPTPPAIKAFAKTQTIMLWIDEPTIAAFTEMWSWGNSVPNAVDARGNDLPQMLPATVADFAYARHLSRVNVSVPWAADSGGPVTDWVNQSVTTLHSKGIRAIQLGGDNGWVYDTSLVSIWINAGLNAAPFDGVELDVEPWAGNPGWKNDPVAVGQLVNMLVVAQGTAHSRGVPLGFDIPWWFATTPYQSGTILDAVIPHIDRGIVVAFSDHADGQDGIVNLALPAAEELNTAGLDFTVGVETDTAAVAQGDEFTFNEEGEHVLEDETGKVSDALGDLEHYKGICVEHYRSWAILGN